jgi:Domain of unknown function (DUF5664)
MESIVLGGTAASLNPYSDIIEKLRNVPDDADGADLRKLAAEIRTQIPESSNPKDRIGQAKVSISTIPGVALLYESCAMANGKMKYGPFNWREHSVSAMIYIDAMLRHIYSWVEREEDAPDSHVHHLGHARACSGIILDAQVHGNLIDDRPQGSGQFVKLLSELNAKGLKA